MMSLFKKGLLVLSIVMLSGVVALASENAGKSKRVYISENFQFAEQQGYQEPAESSEAPDTLLEHFLFFFCGGSISNFRIGNAYFFFSGADIGENVAGNIYAVFSELKMETINTGLNIKTLFSKVFMPAGLTHDEPVISRIFGWTSIFSRTYVLDNQNVYDDTISPMLFRLIKELLIVALFSLFFAIRKSFFEQAALAFRSEWGRVIKSGLSVYFVLLCAIVVFLLTVFGIILSAMVAVVAVAVAVVGSAALSLFIGGLIAEKTGIKRGLYAEMILGVFSIELVAAIPFAGIAVNTVIIPIMALGIVYTALMNMFVKKNFYESPYAIG